jgi:hypothetical protein
MKPAIKTQVPSELAAAPKSEVATTSLKLSVQSVDERRLARAKAASKSQHIRRFNPLQQAQSSETRRSSVTPQVQRIKVQPAPTQRPATQTRQQLLMPEVTNSPATNHARKLALEFSRLQLL